MGGRQRGNCRRLRRRWRNGVKELHKFHSSGVDRTRFPKGDKGSIKVMKYHYEQHSERQQNFGLLRVRRGDTCMDTRIDSKNNVTHIQFRIINKGIHEPDLKDVEKVFVTSFRDIPNEPFENDTKFLLNSSLKLQRFAHHQCIMTKLLKRLQIRFWKQQTVC